MTQLVILDFDGTLADTQPLIVSSIHRTLAELHLPSRTDDECRSIIGLPLRECFIKLLGLDPSPLQGTALSGGNNPDIAELCADTYRRIFDEDNHPGVVTLFPHVLETLETLHDRGFQMAICSSRGRPTLDGFVSTFHLEEYFSMVVGASDVQHHKPHPEPVQLILRQLNVPAGNALMVGDASYDILMGRNAGCRTCGVTYGNQSAADLRAAGADFLIDDFADLMNVI